MTTKGVQNSEFPEAFTLKLARKIIQNHTRCVAIGLLVLDSWHSQQYTIIPYISICPCKNAFNASVFLQKKEITKMCLMKIGKVKCTWERFSH